MASRLSSALQLEGSLFLISSRQAKAAAPTTSTNTTRAVIQRPQWAVRRGGEIAGSPAL